VTRRLSLLRFDPDETAWMDRAACTGLDPDLFHPISLAAAAYEDARKVCASCPVAEHCLDYALAHRIDHGVWGGHTAPERRRLRRTEAANHG